MTVSDGWSQVPISEVADFSSGELISVAKLSTWSLAATVPVFGGNGVAGYTGKSTIEKPTVILGRVGQRCGVVYTNPGAAWVTDNALYARAFKRRMDVKFFAYALENARLNDLKNRNDLPLITQGILRDARIPIPDSIDEQVLIAGALTDADDFISSLERLISKKRDIKQGVMRDLLSDRNRLPGFTADWSVRRIGDFADVRAGGTPSTAVPRYWGGEVRWMSSGEIHKKRVSEVAGRITQDGLRESSAQLLPVGTVLMALAGQGKTRGTVAVSRVELATNQSVAGIFPSDQHDSDFLYYNLDTRYDELRAASAGDGGRGGLNLTIIKRLDVLMPRVDEQRAIAAVLRDVDSEITVLERRLEAAQAVKTGMMQELLTGRTRLPVEAAS